MTGRKASYLSTRDIASLNHACIPITEAFGNPPYLVGSSTERPDFRDVDVRLILPDDEFDALFDGRPFFWSLFGWSVSEWLTKQTGLPIDFQVQRMTEANEKFPGGGRNPMGMRARLFAGGGDATKAEFPHALSPEEQAAVAADLPSDPRALLSEEDREKLDEALKSIAETRRRAERTSGEIVLGSNRYREAFYQLWSKGQRVCNGESDAVEELGTVLSRYSGPEWDEWDPWNGERARA